MKKCPKCGRNFSDDVEKCMVCNVPVITQYEMPSKTQRKKPSKKLIVATVIICIASLAFWSCIFALGSKPTPTPIVTKAAAEPTTKQNTTVPATTEKEKETTEPATTAKPIQKRFAAFDDFYITATKDEIVSYGGEKILVVYYKFENISEYTINFDETVADIAYQDGVQCFEPGILWDEDIDMNKCMQNIKPGVSLIVPRAYILEDENKLVDVEIQPMSIFKSGKETFVFND